MVGAGYPNLPYLQRPFQATYIVHNRPIVRKELKEHNYKISQRTYGSSVYPRRRLGS